MYGKIPTGLGIIARCPFYINSLLTSYYRIGYGIGNSVAKDVGVGGLQLETPYHGFQLEK